MGKVKIKHAAAAKLADKIVAELDSACDRIAIAGSVRRRASFVGDIELVIIARHAFNLLGDPGQSLLDDRLAALVQAGRLQRGRCNGDRFKQLLIPAVPGLALDLFIVTEATWGVQLAIRTGPAAYSKALVTQRKHGGLLDDGLAVAEGRLWPDDQVMRGMMDSRTYNGPFVITRGDPIDTPEEPDFLGHAGGWVDPAERGAVCVEVVP